MQHALMEPGAIGLVSSDALENLGESLRILPMGRELVVPVISPRNPRIDEILNTGISPSAFAREYPLVCCQNVAEEYLDLFLPQGLISGKPVLVSGTEEMAEYLSRNPGALGFCPLAELNTWQGRHQANELILVPIDANGNGTIDHLEDIYRSPAQLERGAWIGKYPRALSKTLYAVTRSGALEEEELAFLDWLSLEGQERLAMKGYTSITLEELRSIKEELAQVPPSVIPMVEEAKSGKVLWLVLGLLLVLVLLFFSVPSLFQRWALEEDPYRVAHQAAQLGSSAGAPGGFFFDKSHTWAFLDKDGRVRVGIDEFLQNVTGPITRVVMKQPGEKVSKGDTLLKLVQRGKQLEIKSPVSGMVVEQNGELLSDSSAINNDPYEEGWICRVEPLDWMKDLRGINQGRWL
jgi:glycine cleavage system H lipoate-binding protein